MFLPKVKEQVENNANIKDIEFLPNFNSPRLRESRKAAGLYSITNDFIFVNLSACQTDLHKEIVVRHESDHKYQYQNNSLRFGFNPEDFQSFSWLRFTGLINTKVQSDGKELPPLIHSHLTGYHFNNDEFETWCRDYLHFCWRKSICPEDFESVKRDPESSILGYFPYLMEELDSICLSKYFNESVNSDLVLSYQPGWLIKEIKNLWW